MCNSQSERLQSMFCSRCVVLQAKMQRSVGAARGITWLTRSSCNEASTSSTVDATEISKFATQAAKWWHPRGSAAPLHRMNPTRIAYIRSTIERNVLANRPLSPDDEPYRKPLIGVDVIDVGCGGGLVTEPLARLGANVLGIDKSQEGIAVAKYHAEKDPVLASSGRLLYREAAVENVAETFDVVLALEIIEHVAEPDSFIRHCAGRVRDGGVLILSTLNRTVASYGLGVFAAERILGWLPPGTHDWTRFPTPEEVTDVVNRQTPLKTDEVVGVAFNPLTGRFSLVADTSINYILTAVKPVTKSEECSTSSADERSSRGQENADVKSTIPEKREREAV